ncbi:MAG: ComEC/Rec2 family competence protein [Clostridium sp.]|uniref:ComEC/Rec2 family competence protein n=1 Tax=Clostridium sp. TaxID=1506 RepID=UPI0030742C97
MNKFTSTMHFITGVVIVFFSIMIISLEVDSLTLFSFALPISLGIIYFIKKKLQLKPKKYYSVLAAFVVITFIVAAVSVEPIADDSATGKNQDVSLGAGNNQGKEDKPITTEGDKDKETSGDTGSIEKQDTVVEASEAKIHFINTGNSDSILIVQGDKSVLIDGGDNDDEGLVSSYVKNQGIKKLTYIISTHPDADHAGGLDAVINSIGVENLFVSNRSGDTKTYTDFINAAASKGAYSSVPLEGSQYEISKGSYIKFYNSNGGNDSNESSLVTLFVNGNDKFLFMGDAGVETEGEIKSQLPDVDVVKIGHHGSKTSTSQELLNAISPEYAVILVGADNKYKHPSTTTMDKLKAKGVNLHRTDECGNIIFTSTGQGVETSCNAATFTPGDSGSTSGGGASNNPVTPKPTPTPTPTPPPTSVPSTAGKFIITTSGTKYHLSSCRTIKQVKEEVTREAAEAKGYGPCGVCHP